jgi:hypothetical protein
MKLALPLQVPAAYVGHLSVLKLLGTRDTASPEDMLRLLGTVCGAAGGRCLNINECRALIRLLRALCDAADPAAVAQIRSAAQRGAVWVPAADGRAVRSGACVHTATATGRLLSR